MTKSKIAVSTKGDPKKENASKADLQKKMEKQFGHTLEKSLIFFL